MQLFQELSTPIHTEHLEQDLANKKCSVLAPSASSTLAPHWLQHQQRHAQGASIFQEWWLRVTGTPLGEKVCETDFCPMGALHGKGQRICKLTITTKEKQESIPPGALLQELRNYKQVKSLSELHSFGPTNLVH